MICKSDTIMIRKFTLDDIDSFYNFCQQEKITNQFHSWKVNKEGALRLVKSFIEEYKNIDIREKNVSFLVERNKDKAVVGYCLLGPEPETHEVEIVCAIHPLYQNSGFASELTRILSEWAFNNYNLDYLVATVDCDNHPSIHVIEKSGFKRVIDEQYEGVLYYRLYKDKVKEYELPIT